jgi:DNA-binding response OmpR family regulator
MGQPSQGSRPRILIVEDDPNTLSALTRWLEYEYEVVAARDGLEGLEAAAKEPRPDVILADVWMPRLDGVGMVSQLKKIDGLRRIPVILLSGETSLTNVIAGISAGARAYLHKPVDLTVLDRKVRSALEHGGSLRPPQVGGR